MDIAQEASMGTALKAWEGWEDVWGTIGFAGILGALWVLL